MQTRCFIWISPDDCIAPHGLDLSDPHDADKVEDLRKQFASAGFDLNQPALVGYPLDNKIQLLSRTHRHLAAKLADTKLPVTLWLRSDVERMWGTELWTKVLEDIPVYKLMEWDIQDGFNIPPYEPINLADLGDRT